MSSKRRRIEQKDLGKLRDRMKNKNVQNIKMRAEPFNVNEKDFLCWKRLEALNSLREMCCFKRWLMLKNI